MAGAFGIIAGPPAPCGCALRGSSTNTHRIGSSPAHVGRSGVRYSSATLNLGTDSSFRRSYKSREDDHCRTLGQSQASRLHLPRAPGSTSSLFASERLVRSTRSMMHENSSLRSVGAAGGARGSITVGRHRSSAVHSRLSGFGSSASAYFGDGRLQQSYSGVRRSLVGRMAGVPGRGWAIQPPRYSTLGRGLVQRMARGVRAEATAQAGQDSVTLTPSQLHDVLQQVRKHSLVLYIRSTPQRELLVWTDSVPDSVPPRNRKGPRPAC